MTEYSSAQIRNVVLVGHGGSGKTSLAEALLLRAGVISRVGGVMDHDPEEKDRGSSLSLSLAQFAWQGYKINLLDTPGLPDFIGEVAAALAVADLAVFVINGVEGVEVQTEIIWKMASACGLPRAIFINKLDRERANFDAVFSQLQQRFGSGLAPLQLPIGQEAGFHGIADLLTDQAYGYDREAKSASNGKDGAAGRGVGRAVAMPHELADREHQVHDSLVEGIVMGDDDLLEKYLDGEVPSYEALAKILAKGIRSAAVFPVVCGSASTMVGVDRLLQLIVEEGPSPLDGEPVLIQAGGQTFEIAPSESGDPLAFVFKSIADRHVGQLSLIKTISGRLHPDDHLVVTRTGHDVRLHSLLSLLGSDQFPATGATAGDIIAVAKLSDVNTNDTLSAKGRPVSLPPLSIPRSTLPIAIKAKTQADEDKLGNALHRLLNEDPSLHLERNEETHQTVLWGQGETHLRIALERLSRKFGVGVETEPIVIAYRETITGTAEAEGRHKKQSGGKGQYGVCSLRVTNREPGHGIEFIDAVIGGAIPRQFIPAVHKGVTEAASQGGALGFPVVDVAVTLFDGKFHAVDSDEMSFRLASRQGFRDACAAAGPVLLEPVSRLEIVVPIAVQGDVMGDLTGRRGRVQRTEAAGDGEQLIVAHVPTSELLRYAIDLRSLSAGRGRFEAHHDHYAPVAANVTEKILANHSVTHS